MKLVFITQDDPFYVRIFFEEFMARYPDVGEVRGVIIGPAMNRKGSFDLARQMWGFYGPRDFFRMGFRFARVRLLDRVSAVVPLSAHSVSQVCRRSGVPVLYSQDVNGEATLAALERIQPDLIISVAAPQIFRSRLIALPRMGCINVHNGKLPRYRGMLPTFWQLYHGEHTVVTTVHRINGQLDDGEILLERETQIIPEESLESLIIRSKRIAAELIVEAITRLREGTIISRVNQKSESTYFTFPTPAEVKIFRSRGYRLL